MLRNSTKSSCGFSGSPQEANHPQSYLIFKYQECPTQPHCNLTIQVCFLTLPRPTTARADRYEARLARRQLLEPRMPHQAPLLAKIQAELRGNLLVQILQSSQSERRAALDLLARVEIMRDSDGVPPLITQTHIDSFMSTSQ